MEYIWRTLSAIGFGAVAVNILHLDANPTYLMLFIGWVCLGLCIVEFTMLIDALSKLVPGNTKTEGRQ